jgi:hypothetical protein
MVAGKVWAFTWSTGEIGMLFNAETQRSQRKRREDGGEEKARIGFG